MKCFLLETSCWSITKSLPVTAWKAPLLDALDVSLVPAAGRRKGTDRGEEEGKKKWGQERPPLCPFPRLQLCIWQGKTSICQPTFKTPISFTHTLIFKIYNVPRKNKSHARMFWLRDLLSWTLEISFNYHSTKKIRDWGSLWTHILPRL